MPGSFSASKRRSFNRELPEVRAMLAAANYYGYNRGNEQDSRTIVWLFREFTALEPGLNSLEADDAGTRLSLETVGSAFPMAVDVAWAIASRLTNADCLAVNSEMTSHGVNMAATFFEDEFPGRTRTRVLGKKLWNRRIPAAYAAVLLMGHADAAGLVGPDPQT